jgi:hypothetical protein
MLLISYLWVSWCILQDEFLSYGLRVLVTYVIFWEMREQRQIPTNPDPSQWSALPITFAAFTRSLQFPLADTDS